MHCRIFSADSLLSQLWQATTYLALLNVAVEGRITPGWLLLLWLFYPLLVLCGCSCCWCPLLGQSCSFSSPFVFLLGTSTRRQMPPILGNAMAAGRSFQRALELDHKCSGPAGGKGHLVCIRGNTVVYLGRNSDLKIRTEILSHFCHQLTPGWLCTSLIVFQSLSFLICKKGVLNMTYSLENLWNVESFRVGGEWGVGRCIKELIWGG